MDDDQLDELRENFDYFDADSNGVIDLEEFTRLLDALHAEMSLDEIQTGFRAIDTDHNGRIDFEEFCAWWGDR
jgi:Ca2+-binding EF-hand superfamily protein